MPDMSFGQLVSFFLLFQLILTIIFHVFKGSEKVGDETGLNDARCVVWAISKFLNFSFMFN